MHFKPARRVLLTLLLFAWFGNQAFAQLPDPLQLQSGLISGSRENKLTVFRGIPYAAPPVGQNRWRDPQPVPQWAGVRDGSGFAPRCIGRGFEVNSTQALASEDCLYLNVWTPAQSDTDLLPVMVWVHGGGFFAGAGSDEIYDGASLAEKGAIVVTLNYRLGSFGFFAHPELSAESPHDSSGNYSLLDMLAALQWVQDNIQAFGGNADNVTLFGESAGAQAIANLVASPLSEDLFQRAILQSGGWMGMGIANQTPLAEHEAAGETLMQEFGAASIGELRQAPAQAIFDSFPNAGEILVDGYVLPRDASLIFAAGAQQPVDIIVGSNENEAVFFGPGITEADSFTQAADTKYGTLAADYLSLYPADSDSEANNSYLHSFNDEIAWQLRLLARYQEGLGNNAYVYFFTRIPPGQEERGATHVAELAYVFNQHAQNDSWTDTDRTLADTMADYWVRFAENGNPNRTGMPVWPVYTDHSPGKVQVLGNEVRNDSEMVPSREEINFFNRAFDQLLLQLQQE